MQNCSLLRDIQCKRDPECIMNELKLHKNFNCITAIKLHDISPKMMEMLWKQQCVSFSYIWLKPHSGYAYRLLAEDVPASLREVNRQEVAGTDEGVDEVLSIFGKEINTLNLRTQ